MKRTISILVFTCACIYSQAQVNIITTIAGKDTAAYCCDGEPAINAEFNHPNQLCLDNFGNLYIADALNNRVRKIVLSTGIITTVAGTGVYGYSGDDSQATNAQLWLPAGVCTDANGNVYIADGFNRRIRKITASTGIITTIAGNGIAGNIGDGSPATNAEINGPQGITIDKFGNLFMTDVFNNNVRKISTSGIIVTVAGNGTMGYSGDGGPAIGAELNAPGDIGIDSSGNIIISDEDNHRVRKVNVSTGIISTIAGNGTPGYSGNGGLSVNAEMSYPYGVFIDKENNIFIVEGGNAVVRKIDGLTGIISTVAGDGTIGFSGDGGPATAAELQPDDVWIDSFGTMYIADFSNNRIRKVYNPKLGVPVTISKEVVVIYPNPANDELTIEKAVGNEMNIYNLLGQQIYKTSITSNKQSININNLPSATYIIQLTNGNGEKQNFRVVKE